MNDNKEKDLIKDYSNSINNNSNNNNIKKKDTANDSSRFLLRRSKSLTIVSRKQQKQRQKSSTKSVGSNQKHRRHRSEFRSFHENKTHHNNNGNNNTSSNINNINTNNNGNESSSNNNNESTTNGINSINMNFSIKNIAVIGCGGSGKSTFCKQVQSWFGMSPSILTGEISSMHIAGMHGFIHSLGNPKAKIDKKKHQIIGIGLINQNVIDTNNQRLVANEAKKKTK